MPKTTVLALCLAPALLFGLASSFPETALAAPSGSTPAGANIPTPNAARQDAGPSIYLSYLTTSGATYSLMLSRTCDRANPVKLDGQTVSGTVYLFLSPGSGVDRVRFYIDNSTEVFRTEDSPPYDLMGGDGDANAYDSAGLSNGSHSIQAQVDANGGAYKLSSSFTVHNTAPTATATPTPAAAPTATGTPTSTWTPAASPTLTLTPTATGTQTSTATPAATRTSIATQTSTATRTPTLAPTATPTPAIGSGLIQWGVNVSGAPWNMASVNTFESNSGGKKVSIVHWYFTWDNGSGGYRAWVAGPADNVVNHGSNPLIDWSPEGGDETRWRLDNITNGLHDAYIRQFATALKNWNHPIYIRMMHEMNGNWFNWSEDKNGNSRGDFVPAWKHIVDIFRSVGASNVEFVWCPNVVYAGATWPTLQSLYPGNDYVDWTCLDGYNWGSDFPCNGGWMTWDMIFNYAYNQIVGFAGARPMMIAEFGTSEKGGSKGDWFRDALQVQVPQKYTKVRAVVYFNYVMDGVDWRIESSAGSLSGWQESIGTSYYKNGR